MCVRYCPVFGFLVVLKLLSRRDLDVVRKHRLQIHNLAADGAYFVKKPFAADDDVKEVILPEQRRRAVLARSAAVSDLSDVKLVVELVYDVCKNVSDKFYQQ